MLMVNFFAVVAPLVISENICTKVVLCVCVCVLSIESFRFNSTGSHFQTWLSVRVRRRGHIQRLKSKAQPRTLYYK